MTERISADEYRRLVGAPPRGRPERRFDGKGLVNCQRSILNHLAPTALGLGKRQHALGRLASGEMNKTEARFEREHLAREKVAGTIAWYAFEAIKLRIAPRTFLTVDFFVLYADGSLECIDVKGAKAIVEEDAKVKMKVAAATFPFRFKLAFPRPRKLGGGWLIEEVGK